MNFDWRSVLVTPTAQIIRDRIIPDDAGAGVLWSSNADEVRELSAYGVLAWQSREDRPRGGRYEWVGFNLLCNAAPTPFVLDEEGFASLIAFTRPSSFRKVRRSGRNVLSLRHSDAAFAYRGKRIRVHSGEHEGLVAAAITAKVAQNPGVQIALSETGHARLAFPMTFSRQPGALARATPLALMIERWKRFDRARPHWT